MQPLTVTAAAAAMQGQLEFPAGWSGSDRLPFPHAAIDSREVLPGDCFFAIQGERDGHDFIPDACRAGAGLVVASRSAGEFPVPAILVPDTTLALQAMGRQVREAWGGQVFALTGSMGKTTTRQVLAALLETRFRVLQTPGNFNNHLGLPLSLLGLQSHHQIAVLELGMNHPGEIARLAEICRPDAGLVTNVAPVHTEFLGSLEAVALAKEELVRALPEAGWLVANADDPQVTAMARRYAGRTVWFGLDSEAEYRVSRWWIRNLGATHFELRGPGFELEADFSYLGSGFLANAVAAIAAAVELGVHPSVIPDTLRGLKPAAHRGQLHILGDITIYDDAYNSNPQAVSMLLAAISQVRSDRRWILALGDMLELGARSPDHHRQIGTQVAECLPDLLITVGSETRHLADAARRGGFPRNSHHHFQDSEQAAAFIRSLVQPGDLVVVKGSRGMKMERIVEVLQEVAA